MDDARTEARQTPGKRFPRPNALHRGPEQSLGDEPANSHFHGEGNALVRRYRVALPSVWKRTSRESAMTSRKKRNSIHKRRQVSPDRREKQFSIRFPRLLPFAAAPIAVVRRTEITLRCANNATASRYINRLYGSLRDRRDRLNYAAAVIPLIMI